MSRILLPDGMFMKGRKMKIPLIVMLLLAAMLTGLSFIFFVLIPH